MYSIEQDIIDAITEDIVIQLTDDDRTGNIDSAIVTAQIQRADNEIDGYVSVRYVTPLNPVPGIIENTSIDLAIYYLYMRRSEVVPEARKDAYTNAVKLLKSISKGDVKLGAEEPTEKSPGNGAAIVGGNERQFTRNKMRGGF